MARRFDPVHLGSPRFHTREEGPFLVTDAWFPPGLCLPPHQHDRAVVAVTFDGGWDSVMLRRPYECATGTLLVEPAGERHSNHFGSAGGRVIVMQPDLSSGLEFDAATRALEQPLAVGFPSAVPLALRLRDEIHAPDAISPLAIEALCLELVVVAARRVAIVDRTPPRWLTRVADHLHAHAREPMTLAGIAAVAGVHPAHLAREFRRHQGMSVASYVRSLRLAWASERLIASSQSIAGIASEAGFADQSHFTRAFRRHCGRTPRAFRGAAGSTASPPRCP